MQLSISGTVSLWRRLPRQTLKVMKLTAILLTVAFLQVHAKSISQVTISVRNVSVEKVFRQIERQTGVGFIYTRGTLAGLPPVTLSVTNAPVREVLDECFKSGNIEYSIDNKVIVVTRKATSHTLSPLLPLTMPLLPPPVEIRGRVVDQQGNPLANVSVIITGTSIGTTTDDDGRFVITAPDNKNLTLEFSSVGFVTQKIGLKNKVELNVVMVRDISSLNAVVVTALGLEQAKKTLSYSTQQVNTKALTEARSTNLVNSLEGKVAGLSISETGSGVGAPSRVTLRGNKSINGDSQPLYIIDGVPVIRAPQYLTADNIASINVLKGANAAALYGSEAQNGAIIITTKKGTEGTRVSFNNTFTMSNADIGVPFQNEYGQGFNGTYQKGSGYSWGPKMDGHEVETWSLNPARSGETYPFSPQPNNVNDIFQTGFDFTHNLQAILGGKTTQAFFSATSTEAKDILPSNTLQRNNLLVRVTSQLSTKFSLDAKVTYTRQKIKGLLRQSTNNFNPIQQIYDIPRNIRTVDAEDYEFLGANGVMQQDFWAPGFSSTAENPYWVLNRNLFNAQISRMTGMTSLTYKFNKSLELMGRVSYDEIDEIDHQSDYNGTLVRALMGMYGLTKNQQYEFNADFLLSFEKEVATNWQLTGRFGGNLRKQLSGETFTASTGPALLAPNLFTMSNSNFPVVSDNPGALINVQSLYAFGQLGWKDAVFLSLTGRNDWSSTLPKNNRSYFYPSVGLSVVLSDLIPNFPSILNSLKLRGSYAEVGNGAQPFMLQRTASFSPGGNNGFLSLSSVLPNRNLKPERTRSFEGGVDLAVLENRIGVGITYFKTNTVDQLFTIALPVASGASSFYTNGGNIQNKGLEITLNTKPISTNNLSWNMDFNFSHLKNTVVSISDERPKVVVASSFTSDYVIQQGLEFGSIFTNGFVRDDQGNVIVNDLGLPEIDNSKSVNIGSYTPKWVGSVSNTVNFKSWGLSFLITHRQGGVVESFTQAALDFLGLTENTLPGRDGGLIFGGNTFTKYTAVKENGQHNDIPITAQSLYSVLGNVSLPVGEVYAQDATNMRLKEVVFSYNLPNLVLKKIHLTDVRLSLVGRNLFFIYRAVKGLDPDILSGTTTSSEGFTTYAPPTSRTFGLSLNIVF